MIDSAQEENSFITPRAKPIVIGIYGLPGSGKSYLLSHLRRYPKLANNVFKFVEGSEVIAQDIEGGLEAFHQLSPEEKSHRRQTAIHSIQRSTPLDQVSIVAGHFMFWPEENESGDQVLTASDLEVYTHIIYMSVPAETISERRQNDTRQSRTPTSAEHLQRWQDIEQNMLKALCRESGIAFSVCTYKKYEYNPLHDLFIHPSSVVESFGIGGNDPSNLLLVRGGVSSRKTASMLLHAKLKHMHWEVFATIRQSGHNSTITTILIYLFSFSKRI
ncbi:hypothetical protein EAE96_010909 [Botrytis aclada]|nr:hypothetical protein EAE96_010909 [Botrytis aclada]